MLSFKLNHNCNNWRTKMSETEIKTKKKATGITKDATLSVLVDANPKRQGSAAYDRFEGYLTSPAPSTVQEALDNGLTMGDINYDFIAGSIEVEGASVEEYTPTPRGPRKAADDAEEVSETEATEEVF